MQQHVEIPRRCTTGATLESVALSVRPNIWRRNVVPQREGAAQVEWSQQHHASTHNGATLPSRGEPADYHIRPCVECAQEEATVTWAHHEARPAQPRETGSRGTRTPGQTGGPEDGLTTTRIGGNSRRW